jgi:hypothetical protein
MGWVCLRLESEHLMQTVLSPFRVINGIGGLEIRFPFYPSENGLKPDIALCPLCALN